MSSELVIRLNFVFHTLNAKIIDIVSLMFIIIFAYFALFEAQNYHFFRVVKSEVGLQDILDKWVNYLKRKEIMSRIDFEM